MRLRVFVPIRILGGSEALVIAYRKKQKLSVGREGDLAAFLAALAPGQLAPQYFEVFEFSGGAGQFGAGEGKAAAVQVSGIDGSAGTP